MENADFRGDFGSMGINGLERENQVTESSVFEGKWKTYLVHGENISGFEASLLGRIDGTLNIFGFDLKLKKLTLHIQDNLKYFSLTVNWEFSVLEQSA